MASDSPGQGGIAIQINFKSLSDVFIDLFSLSGQKVYSAKYRIGSDGLLELDLGLEQGLYIYKISGKDKTEQGKLYIVN